MSLHQRESGVRLIAALLHLGEVLGYHVAAEHPVDDSSQGPAPAVDVAWFATSGQRFPLMIFEVESSATNAIPNNALKVYGPEISRFEKPLFFFHIIHSRPLRLVAKRYRWGNSPHRRPVCAPCPGASAGTNLATLTTQG